MTKPDKGGCDMNIETLRKLDIGGILDSILIRRIPVREFTWNGADALLVDGNFVIYPVGNMTLGVAIRFEIPIEEGSTFDSEELGVFNPPLAIARIASEIVKSEVEEAFNLEVMYHDLGGIS